MENKFISKEEWEKCARIAKAFEEVYEMLEMTIVDAGKYGFVKLQYYSYPQGFDVMETYTDSKAMFEDLWEMWLDTSVYLISQEADKEKDAEAFFKSLPQEKKDELMDKRKYFAQKADYKEA